MRNGIKSMKKSPKSIKNLLDKKSFYRSNYYLFQSFLNFSYFRYTLSKPLIRLVLFPIWAVIFLCCVYVIQPRFVWTLKDEMKCYSQILSLGSYCKQAQRS